MFARPRTAGAIAAAVALSLPAAVPAQAAPKRPAPDVIDGQYIVVYESGVQGQQTTADLERRHGFKTRLRYRKAVSGFAAKLTDVQRDRVARDPAVAYVAPDRRVRAIGSVVPGDSVPPGVRRFGAASTTTVRGAAQGNVAVIDTGIDANHPDLAVAGGTNCITPGAAPADDNGHGTHVAGTIGARNNGSGVVGVAPGTRLFAVKVLAADGSGTTSQIICGLDWVTATRTDADATNDIAVANMSLGGVGSPVKTCATTTDPEHAAVCRATNAGVTVVAAAGNDGWDFDYATSPDTPAAYPEVLTVTAMADTDGLAGATGVTPSCRSGEADDRYASFSNFALTAAGEAHAVAAPGTCIVSTRTGGGLTTMSGTSMAAPHMAGAVALCLGEGTTAGPCAGKTPAQVIAHVRADAQARAQADAGYGFSGDPLRPYGTRRYGHLAWIPAAAAAPTPTPTPTLTHVAAAPSARTIQSGTLRSGTAASLAADDASMLEVTSTSTTTRTTAWYGTFSGVKSTPANLRVTYSGANTRSCTQTVALWNSVTGAWVTLDSRAVGTTEQRIDVAAGGRLADYVDASGNVFARVRCTTTAGSFYARADLLRLDYDA